MDTAKNNGVVLLTLPPHISQRLHPLDRSVYGPFKTYYSRALDSWMRANPARTASIYNIPKIVNSAFLSAMTPNNIVSGLRSTGIFPFNRDIFQESDFAPAIVTDRPVPDNSTATSHDEPEPSGSGSSDTAPDSCACNVTNPGGITKLQLLQAENPPIVETPKEGYVSPADILPLPNAKSRKTHTTCKRGRTKVPF